MPNNTKLMARYLWLLLIHHIASFPQLLPWTFVGGLLVWPWYFVQGILVSNEHKRHCVVAGSKWMLEEREDMPLMTSFIRRRLEILQREASNERHHENRHR